MSIQAMKHLFVLSVYFSHVLCLLPWQNWTLPIPTVQDDCLIIVQRVADLVSRLTLDEKISQLSASAAGQLVVFYLIFSDS